MVKLRGPSLFTEGGAKMKGRVKKIMQDKNHLVSVGQKQHYITINEIIFLLKCLMLHTVFLKLTK